MAERQKRYHTAIAGGGPAATAVPAAVDSRDSQGLKRWAKKGIAVVSDTLGAGKLASYDIFGNSDGAGFIDGTSPTGFFSSLRRGKHARVLESAALVHLASEVAPFLQQRGELFRELLEQTPESDVFLGTKVARLRQKRRFLRRTLNILETPDGRTVGATHAILATGGKEKKIPGFEEKFGWQYLLSGEVIDGTRMGDIKKTIDAGKTIVFIAASHSTYAAIYKVLEQFGNQIQRPGQLLVLSKKAPAVFFPSREAANKAGYKFGKKDVCGVTGRVNRFGGLRNKAAEVYLGGDKRVQLQIVEQVDVDTPSLQKVGLVISGIGYETNVVPVVDKHGVAIGPLIGSDGQVAVDQKGRVLGKNRRPLKRVYGIGLGYGIRPTRRLGGERSFKGRLDGINIFDQIVGPKIAEQVFL